MIQLLRGDAVKELKMFLQADHQGLLNNLENLYAVLVFRAIHSNLNQILTSWEVLPMENLIPRILRVPPPNALDSCSYMIDTSAKWLPQDIVVFESQGSWGGGGLCGCSCLQCIYCNNQATLSKLVISLMDFLRNLAISHGNFSQEEEIWNLVS